MSYNGSVKSQNDVDKTLLKRRWCNNLSMLFQELMVHTDKNIHHIPTLALFTFNHWLLPFSPRLRSTSAKATLCGDHILSHLAVLMERASVEVLSKEP